MTMTQTQTWPAWTGAWHNMAASKSVPSPRRMTLLQHYGLQAMSLIAGTSGFEMRVFLPIPKGQKNHKPSARPVVAFRGSEGSKLTNAKDASGRLDFDDDLRSRQVGERQFRENHDLIRFWLNLAHQKGLPAVTGHSLGGALAQMTACAWPELTGQVVTFQAPAINPGGMANLKHFNAKHEKDGRAIVSQHVRFDNDVVEQAGNALTPGFMHRFATPASPLMATLSVLAQPLAAVAGFGVGGVSGEWQMLRGRMNPWEALKMPFKGAATGFNLGYRLPRTGEHTTPAVRDELIARDPEAMKLFGKTKGVGAKVDYLSSERVNDLGARPYERLREDVGGVDTTNPQYVEAHQKLSEIAQISDKYVFRCPT